jgi:hypothetical protein
LISDGPHAQEIRSAKQDLPDLLPAFQLATQMGARLGAGDLLLDALPRHGQGGICKEDLKQSLMNWSEKFTTLVADRKLFLYRRNNHG